MKTFKKMPDKPIETVKPIFSNTQDIREDVTLSFLDGAPEAYLSWKSKMTQEDINFQNKEYENKLQEFHENMKNNVKK